jgi:hypothetical protein
MAHGRREAAAVERKRRRLEAAARRRGSDMAFSWIVDWSGGEWREKGAGFLQSLVDSVDWVHTDEHERW